ncbi:MAG: helix-turn-helix domain-containing protein [Methylocystaceae bacterium]|nr:helix-turn-helix domain-containing protein [Methylocystaceae bacterium]
MAKPHKKLDPVNLKVGQRLRMKRKLQGLSQQTLGDMIGVSRLVISQFEVGRRAIPASTLYKIATFFQVPVSYFFEEHDDIKTALPSLDAFDPLLTNEAISLLKDFRALGKPEVKKAFAAVVSRAAKLNTTLHNK